MLLCYDKVKVNVDFNNHFIRCAILRIWNRYKTKLSPTIPFWLSTQETLFKREMMVRQKWFIYADLLKIPKENLELEGFTWNWFPYAELMKIFKLNEKAYEFENGKTEFAVEHCTNDDIIAKMYKPLLKRETESKTLNIVQ